MFDDVEDIVKDVPLRARPFVQSRSKLVDHLLSRRDGRLDDARTGRTRRDRRAPRRNFRFVCLCHFESPFRVAREAITPRASLPAEFS